METSEFCSEFTQLVTLKVLSLSVALQHSTLSGNKQLVYDFCCYRGVTRNISEQLGFKVFTAVTMKNSVFWDLAQCGSCNNRRFAVTCRVHLRAEKYAREKSVRRLLTDWTTVLTPNTFFARVFFYPEMEATRYSETSVLTRSAQRHLPEDSILQIWAKLHNFV
jgi:hypothetical protein